ncbi:MAG: hypothetical protein L6R38_003155 [Xanthoria sp. 2 TBL-2021]|nr:MAG: hypothetical protein L6R38_003155 [Xanthoria sp. 2 TBL-2021]
MSFLYQLFYDKLHPPSQPTASFANRTVLVTGANCGLGFEAALKFVSLGAKTVILACRTPSKGEDARSEIEARTGCAKDVIRVMQLDMGSYASIREFMTQLREVTGRGGGLDVALLNAGVVQFEYQVSDEGWEQTLQVNVLGTTYLGILLLPLLNERSSTSATVASTRNLAFVSSGNYSSAELSPQAVSSPNLLQYCNKKQEFPGPEPQYNISKLFLMYAANELAATVEYGGEKNENTSSRVIVNSVNPGATATNLTRNITGIILRIVAYVYLNLLARTAEQGSRSLVSACALGKESHGGFWQDDALVV